MPRAAFPLACAMCVITFGVIAQQLVVRTFDAEQPGSAPAGFELAATRQNRPGTWTIRRESAGQVLAHEADTPRQQGFGLAVAENAEYRDLVVSVRLKLADGDRAGGLVWRYQDRENYYAVSLDLARQEIAMYRVVRGNRIRLEREDDLELDVTAWHSLRVVHEESSARVYLGGVRVFTVRDRTFRGGRAGLWSTSGSTTLFDDFRVQPESSR